MFVAIAFATAFVFLNVAALYGLSRAMSWWLAALVLAAIWIGVGTALLVALMVRAGRVTGWKWWRVFTAGPEESREGLERARAEAEQAVYDTLGRLAPVVTVDIASAALPLAGGMASGVIDAGDDLLQASDDIVESIAEDLPGGSVVNQVWDVCLCRAASASRSPRRSSSAGMPIPDAAASDLDASPLSYLRGRRRRCLGRCRLGQRVLSGASRARTGDLLGAIQALSQLSYSPAVGEV